MTDLQMLRRQAATARRLARGVTDGALAERLNRFADECDEAAETAEPGPPPVAAAEGARP